MQNVARADLRYPRLIKRVQAVLIDSILIPICAIGTLLLGTGLGVSGPIAKLMLLVGPVLVLEPVLVTLTGGTVGHHLIGLRITRVDGVRNLNFFLALVRFVVKVALGWTSFILVFTTRKHQALHDLFARSIVVYRDPATVPAADQLAERPPEGVEYRYPAKWWRLVAIALYLGALFFVTSLLAAALTSPSCHDFNRCDPLELLVMIVMSATLLIGSGALIVMGWRGRLVGSRRRAIQ